MLLIKTVHTLSGLCPKSGERAARHSCEAIRIDHTSGQAELLPGPSAAP